MKIRLRGHQKNVPDYLYERKYKKMGYVIVPEKKIAGKPAPELTKAEVVALLTEKGVKFSPRMSLETLKSMLKE